MYESFYNFKAEPFRLSPDHRFCFTHKSYAKAKAYMQYAIHRAEGFVMVTGKPGTGKTTLVNDLVDGLSHSKIVVATIVSTQLEADDLLRLVSCNFGLDVDAPNKAVVLQGLSVRLKRHHEEGTRALLIIDEAQDLSTSALEELRLLTNLQLNNQPLLQIFLVGQENLRDLVQKPSMEQVHQRLVAACHLESLSEEDTKAYVRHRLDRVGWKDDPIIDEGVYPLVFQFSKGVPRRINLVCSRFLLHGSVEEKHRIRASDVRTVIDELQHEQLTPVGFKGQLPPLTDEDEPELEESGAADEAISAEASGGESDATIENEEEVGPDNFSQDTATGEDDGVQAQVDEDSVRIISLEAQVKREESHFPAKGDGSAGDMIQQNYFSLDDAMDGPSEPVPFQQTAAKAEIEQSYGDRFANAQRQRQAQQSTTHYYSEYQTGPGGQVSGSRKRSVLGLAFVFLIVLGVVLAAVYMIRPQLLQRGINILEERVSQISSSVPVGEAHEKVRNQAPLVRNPDNLPTITPISDSMSDEVSQQTGPEPVSRESLQPESPADDGRASIQVVDTPAVGDPSEGVNRVAQSMSAQASVRDGRDTLDNGFIETDASAALAAKKKVVPPLREEPGFTPPEKVPPVTGQDEQAMLPHPESAVISEPVAEVAQEEVVPGMLPLSEKSESGVTLSMEGEQVQHEPEDTIPTFAPRPVAMSAQTSAVESTPLPAVQKKTPDTLPPADRISATLYFGSDSSTISPGDRQKLDRLVMRLEENPDTLAYIVGYADSIGDPEYNLSLSFKRARAVADYLQAHEIDSGRLRVEGRGVYPESEAGDIMQASTEQSHRQVIVDLLPVDE